jgi:hypothetical protein
MQINPTQSATVERILVEEVHDLIMFGNRRLRKSFEQIQNFSAPGYRAAGQFPNDEWMTQDLSRLEERAKLIVAATEMIHPHGSVNERHDGFPDVACEYSSTFSQFRPNLPVGVRFLGQ